MIDFMVFGGFDDGRTDGQTDGRTFVLLELLSRLKIGEIFLWKSDKYSRLRLYGKLVDYLSSILDMLKMCSILSSSA